MEMVIWDKIMPNENMVQWKEHQPRFVLTSSGTSASCPPRSSAFSSAKRRKASLPWRERVKIVMCASPPSKYSENASDVMCVAACQKAS